LPDHHVDDHMSLLRGTRVGLHEVRALGRHAFSQAQDGILYVYDQGRFWFTNPNEDVPECGFVADETSLPLFPWHHHPRCDCEVCQPAEE
jgi:hypothetical protein